MGLSNFPSPAEGVLPGLVMNTVISVALLKNMVRSVLQGMSGSGATTPNLEDDPSTSSSEGGSENNARARRVLSTTPFDSLCRNRSTTGSSGNIINGGSSGNIWCSMECCVCLCRFEGDEEVSELSCKHFFHKGCLEKWFDNHHTTCPLCRSIL